jgi:predicted nucleic acid-binding protein
MRKIYILDANAVLSYIEEQPGAARMAQLFKDARDDKNPTLMSVINLGEVFYYMLQKYGEEPARKTLGSLARLPIQTVPVDYAYAIEAAGIKARHKIPYADALAAGLAVMRQGVLVTSDSDFEKLGHRLQVLWLQHS